MKRTREERTGIAFEAILNKITTTVDGGWRVTFDVSQSDRESIMKLSEYRDQNLSIGVVTAASRFSDYRHNDAMEQV